MKKGFDTTGDLTRFASSLVKKGYDFVCRYYNINNPSKNLTLAEAHVLSNAGLRMVAIWENGYPITPGYFTHAAGVHDGTSAYYYALQQIGQPPSTPIYFAVDYDASAADVKGPVLSYFNGIRDGFNTISKNNPAYAIGVYGSGLTCTAMLQAGTASFSWLAQSMGWGNSRSFAGYNIAQSLQITECPELGGVTGDPDKSPGDNEGSFVITVS